jgi:hypothetical protein
VNLSTVQNAATVTLTLRNPSDATLAALLALANQPVSRHLDRIPDITPGDAETHAGLVAGLCSI